MSAQHCGFIGLIGRPNVGKSTLLNKIIGQKISITTPKPQTTRNRILGIKTFDSCQMIFIDTPGIHTSDKLLNQRIVQYATQTLHDVDLKVVLVEPIPPNYEEIHPEDAEVLNLLGEDIAKTILLINKIDQVPKEELLRTIALFDQKVGTFAEIVPISALKGTNTDRLLEILQQYMPESPFYFESDQITDISERFLVAEFVREQVFLRLQQELPYATAVQVDEFKEEPKIIRIYCTICVERDSQKGIVIGKQGKMLKTIGSGARRKIETLLGKKVFLSLQVKVLKKWSSNPRHLNVLGLNE